MTERSYTPTEMARLLGVERREVIEKCMELGVPIFEQRIDWDVFAAAAAMADDASRYRITWVLMDSSGNLVDSFEGGDEALRALDEIRRADPDNADHVELIGYNATGDPISFPPDRTKPTQTR